MPELSADEWSQRYVTGDAPWDMRQVSPPLVAFFKEGILPRGRRVVVPGCGSGYEIAALARAGYEATGVDYAPQAVAAAQAIIAGINGASVACVDLLDPRAVATLGAFDWAFDQTFFCAIDPSRRGDYATALALLVRPGGELWALSMRTLKPDGPPFDSTPDEFVALLRPAGFAELERRVLDAESHPARRGRETLVRLRRAS